MPAVYHPTRRIPALAALLLAACAAVCGTTAGQEAAPAAAEPFVVSFHALGPDAEAADAAAQGFINSLDAREGFSARAAAPGGSWSQPPAGAARGRWVSLVLVCFRGRRDWLALLFDGPQGVAAFAVRRPAHATAAKGSRRDWIPPGDSQVSENAVKELAADFGNGYAGRPAGDPARVVRIAVRRWERAADAGGAALFEPADDADAQPVPGAEAAGPAGERVLEGVAALAAAAGAEAGWQPTLGQAPRTLALQVAPGVQDYSIRATLTDAGTRTPLPALRVPAEDLYVNLVRICRELALGGPLRDGRRLGGSLRLLGWSGEGLLVLRDDALEALNPASAEALWAVEPPAGARAAPLYAPRTDAAGRAVVYRWSGGLARMGGKESAATLADTAPDAPWAFAVGPGRDEAAVLSGPALRFFRAGARLWQFDSPRPLVCGPALAEDRFIAGDDEGRLVCLAAADGRLLWERRLDEAPRGALTAAAGLVLGASREGTLYAVAPADGAVRWTQALGDLLLVPPVLMGGRLAVASKGNRIVLLEAATGKEAASVQWPTWLVDVGAAGGRLACTDLRGTVTFLDGAALQPLRSVRLGARLQPGLVYIERFPERWGAGRDLVYEEAPALLAADKAGFLYVLSLPGGEVR